MRSIEYPGATGAPSTDVSRRACVEARGVPAHLAGTVIAAAFAVPKRDHVAELVALTASRCAAAGAGCR